MIFLSSPAQSAICLYNYEYTRLLPSISCSEGESVLCPRLSLSLAASDSVRTFLNGFSLQKRREIRLCAPLWDSNTMTCAGVTLLPKQRLKASTPLSPPLLLDDAKISLIFMWELCAKSTVGTWNVRYIGQKICTPPLNEPDGLRIRPFAAVVVAGPAWRKVQIFFCNISCSFYVGNKCSTIKPLIIFALTSAPLSRSHRIIISCWLSTAWNRGVQPGKDTKCMYFHDFP